MKRIKHITALPVVLVFSLPLLAQKKITEATISYDMVINTSNTTPKAADLFDGATNVIYLKGTSSRSDMINSLGTKSTIVDGKTGKVAILNDYGEKKYMITMTPENWKTSNKKYDGIVFTYENDSTKVIAGYTCQRAIGKLTDGTTFTVYYTKELVPVNKDFQYLNRGLPGLAMQYEAASGSLKMTFTVSSINFSIVPQAKFDLPKSGYRVMSYEESLGAGSN